MKYIYLLLPVLFISACSKDDIGPRGLRHGQEVEVIVDHRYGAIDDRPMLWPNGEPLEYDIYGFDAREPGYIYRVKAKVHLDKSDPPIQDGASHWLNFMNVVSKEKYEGNEPFEIALIQSHVPGGPVIMLREFEGQYHFIAEKISLTPSNEEVESQLNELWQHNLALYEEYQSNGTTPVIKWKAIRATVTHDPDNFGYAYLVSHIEFTE